MISGGSQDNGTSVLNNGVWSDWLGADGMETFIDKDDSNFIYGTSQYGKLYLTRNAGQTFEHLSTPEDKAGVTMVQTGVPFEQTQRFQIKYMWLMTRFFQILIWRDG